MDKQAVVELATEHGVVRCRIHLTGDTICGNLINHIEVSSDIKHEGVEKSEGEARDYRIVLQAVLFEQRLAHFQVI